MYIHSYNQRWPVLYANLASLIKDSVSVPLELQHIGSTSVPGLHAKNCIDIVGALCRFADGAALITPLKQLGFVYKGEYGIHGRHYFSKPADPKCHLHVFVDGDQQIQKHLHFRNVMRIRPDLVAQFNAVKVDLQQRYSQAQYQIQKAEFYRAIDKLELPSN